MSSVSRFPRPHTPRCPRCATPLAFYEEERYCPICTGYTTVPQNEGPRLAEEEMIDLAALERESRSCCPHGYPKGGGCPLCSPI